MENQIKRNYLLLLKITLPSDKYQKKPLLVLRESTILSKMIQKNLFINSSLSLLTLSIIKKVFISQLSIKYCQPMINLKQYILIHYLLIRFYIILSNSKILNLNHLSKSKNRDTMDYKNTYTKMKMTIDLYFIKYIPQ